MASQVLKSHLKSIREKIGFNDNEGALKEIKDLLDKGESDYLLYAFSGLASYNLGAYEDARNYYKKGISIDPSKSNAWLGIFKVFLADTSLVDEFALNVVDHLLKSENLPLDKRNVYLDAKWTFLLKLGHYKTIINDAEAIKDKKFCKLVLHSAEKLTSSEAIELLIKSANYLKSENELDQESHRSALNVLKLHLSYEEWIEFFMQYLENYILQETDEKFLIFLVKEFISSVSYEFFKCGKLNDRIIRAAKLIPDVPKLDFDIKILQQLVQGNTNEAYTLLDPIARNLSWPLLGLGLYVFWNLKQYQRFLDLVLYDTIPVQLKELLKDPIYEARYSVSDDPMVLEKLSVELKHEIDKNSSLAKLYVRILVDLKDKSNITIDRIDELIQEHNLDDHFKHQMKALFYLYSEDYDKSKEHARLATMMGENNWFDIWLSAKVLTIRGQHQAAMAQLVNVAQRNPYVAEIFALLAETLLIVGNNEKAISCIERARSLKPLNEAFAKLHDRILQKLPNSNVLRLDQLNSFLKNRTSKWALKEASILELENGKLDEAIEKFQKLIRVANNDKETAALWSFLGEAYQRKGRLQSAVSAFKAMLEFSPDSITARMQLTRLYISMAHFIEANSELEILKAYPNFPEKLLFHRDVLQAHVGIHLASEEENIDKKISILARSLFQLWDLQRKSNSIFIRNLLADGFEILLNFNSECLDTFIQHAKKVHDWDITPTSISDEQIRLLVFVLRSQINSADCWNELAVAFLYRYLRINQQDELLDKAINCLKSAINLPTSAIKRSSYWCNMGLAYLLLKKIQMAQHCWIRAAQLNRHNETCWGLLSILYFRIGRIEEAYQTMQTAQKLNPSLMEAWCIHALYKHENIGESMDLYRHSIVLKPSELAVKKYSYCLAKCFKENIKIDDGTMIDMKMILRLAFVTRLTDDFLISMAILAEHFGYLDEALMFALKISDENTFAVHINRIHIKATTKYKDHSINLHSISTLHNLYNLPLQQLSTIIEKHSPVRQLFAALQDNDPTHIREFYKPNLYPLLVAFSILRNKVISQALMEEIEEIRPLHKLFDVFPADFKRPEEMITKSGEDRIVLRDDHLSENLYELLSMKKKLGKTVVNGIDIS